MKRYLSNFGFCFVSAAGGSGSSSAPVGPQLCPAPAVRLADAGIGRVAGHCALHQVAYLLVTLEQEFEE